MHIIEFPVFYEDTDMAGIVYYANYLKFIERGRSSMLREVGFSQNALKDDLGIVFAVTDVVAKYHAPARLDDRLRVETTIPNMSRVRVIFDQKVFCGDRRLFSSSVTVACMGQNGRPKPIPETAREAFARFQA